MNQLLHRRNRWIIGGVIYVFLLLGIALVSSSATADQVYICKGSSAYAYHSRSNCSGLNKCNASIVKVDIATAKSQNRKPCKKCYKH